MNFMINSLYLLYFFFKFLTFFLFINKAVVNAASQLKETHKDPYEVEEAKIEGLFLKKHNCRTK